MPRFCATDATPAVRQLARPTSRYSIAVVLRREHLGVVGVEHRLALVAALLPEAEELLDGRGAVHAVAPRGGGPPDEPGGLGGALQHLARVEQRLDVHTVRDCGHGPTYLLYFR
jgi:hypothetical protein